jgi:hypothetical protein
MAKVETKPHVLESLVARPGQPMATISNFSSRAAPASPKVDEYAGATPNALGNVLKGGAKIAPEASAPPPFAGLNRFRR